MRRYLLLVVFLYGFPTWAKFSTEPSGCLDKFSPPCSILTETKSEFQNPEFHLYTSENTLFQFQDAHHIYFAKGILWIQTSQPLLIQTKFGSVDIPLVGEYWLEMAADKLVVKAIRGALKVKPRGSEEIQVQAGTQMYVSYVDPRLHEAEHSVPITINLQQHLAVLNKVFPSKGFDFQQYVTYLGRVVAEAAQTNADWYQGAVQRKITSAEELESRLKYEALHNARRDSYLQKLYRTKNNFEDQ